MRINRLHYITQDHPKYSHCELAEQACQAGVEWVQLRLKNRTENDIFEIGRDVKRICKRYHATFILNDHLQIAKELDTDGIHLGLSDTPIDEARKIVGKNKIIGGTANTAEDVKLQLARGADYIGLGPFRYTSTKENLSPVIGLKGYQQIISEGNPAVPLIAIGGIQPEDIPALRQAGVYGVAVSSGINFAERFEDAVLKFSRSLDSER